MGPEAVAEFIDKNNIDAHLIRLTQEASTVQAAADALGVPPNRILKSVLLLADSTPVLVITNGLSRIDTKQVAGHLNISKKRIRLADPDTTLAITGFRTGGVPPFAHRTRIRTLVDASVLEHDEVFAGGGAPEVVLRLKPSDILKVADAEVLSISSR